MDGWWGIVDRSPEGTDFCREWEMMGRSVCVWGGGGLRGRQTQTINLRLREARREHIPRCAKSIQASLALQSKDKTPIYFIIRATSASQVTWETISCNRVNVFFLSLAQIRLGFEFKYPAPKCVCNDKATTDTSHQCKASWASDRDTFAWNHPITENSSSTNRSLQQSLPEEKIS